MRKMTGSVAVMVTLTAVMLVFSSASNAMMGGGGGGGMMGGDLLKNRGGMSMMSGIAGAPVVGDDGTAYLVTFNPTAAAGMDPTDRSFRSRLASVRSDSTEAALNLRGIISAPVVNGTTLLATVSLPDQSNYTVIGNYGTNPASRQSVLFFAALPLADGATPQAVALDGGYASAPVLANNHIYVVTTDFGASMMQGNMTFQSMFKGYSFTEGGTAKTYLYVIEPNGVLISKTEVK